MTAPLEVLVSQQRINAAIHHQPVTVIGTPATAETYLAEVRVLAVLLLHLACHEGADRLVNWSEAARADWCRSPAGRGARWGLAPPADPVLRGQALAAADHIHQAADTDEAAGRLGPWLDLNPPGPEGQLGWLADRTTMTPSLTRLVMAATSTRRRISTLLAHEQSIDTRWIPQVLPADLYAEHLADLLDVTDATGRLFASLCLARLGRPQMTWADAAIILGLTADMGAKTARACSADILCSAPAFVDEIAAPARRLDETVDYRRREAIVRRLATRTRWYTAWARAHRPGSHATSKRYGLAWLWTTYAGGHLLTSPGWATPPTSDERARYRRYATRLDENAQNVLMTIAVTTAARRSPSRGDAHATTT